MAVIVVDFKTQLAKLSVRVAAGRLKKAEKIGEAAARILGRNHGSRYYGWSFEQGLFRYFEHPVHLPPEKATGTSEAGRRTGAPPLRSSLTVSQLLMQR